jgi:hypothetical protein
LKWVSIQFKRLDLFVFKKYYYYNETVISVAHIKYKYKREIVAFSDNHAYAIIKKFPSFEYAIC